MSELAYYIQKVEEMLALAATAREPSVSREFERLAEEYKKLAATAKAQAQRKRA